MDGATVSFNAFPIKLVFSNPACVGIGPLARAPSCEKPAGEKEGEGTRGIFPYVEKDWI
jgi:hypothetical protein